MATPLDSVLTDDGLRVCASRYDAGLPARWDGLLRQLARNRFVVPVVGVQGAGKSTLLNALVFDEPVLPVDADETTCVPVEIVHGEARRATVHYSDGRTEEVEATEDSLARFVHQASNPGNEMGLARVVVCSASPLLTSGAVLVDLPGLGSLTRENARTTREYLAESSGLIYLLRTVPPMTRSESLDLSLIWPQLPIVYFAQNRWTDESDAEAEAGRDHNLFVLGDLARKLGRSFDGSERRIDVICAYDALAGVLARDPARKAQSGLAVFEDRLGTAFGSWPTLTRASLARAARGDLQRGKDAVARRIGDLSKDHAAALADLDVELSRRRDALAVLGRRFEEVEDTLEGFVGERRKALDSWRSDSRAELRNRMRTLMRKGIVDGPRLDKALVDEQTVVGESAYAAARDAMLVVVGEIGKDIASDKAWEGVRASAAGVGIDETARWEAALSPLAGAAAGAAAMWAVAPVAAAATAKVGAVVGTFIGGPVGTVVGGIAGGVAGLVVSGIAGGLAGLLGSWMGSKGREGVLASRAKANEPEVFRAIDQYTEAVHAGIVDAVERFTEAVGTRLRSWHEEQVARAEAEHAERRAGIERVGADRGAALALLEQDARVLGEALARFDATEVR